MREPWLGSKVTCGRSSSKGSKTHQHLASEAYLCRIGGSSTDSYLRFSVLKHQDQLLYSARPCASDLPQPSRSPQRATHSLKRIGAVGARCFTVASTTLNTRFFCLLYVLAVRESWTLMKCELEDLPESAASRCLEIGLGIAVRASG